MYWSDRYIEKEDSIYDWTNQYIFPWESNDDHTYVYSYYIYNNASFVSINQVCRSHIAVLIWTFVWYVFGND